MHIVNFSYPHVERVEGVSIWNDLGSGNRYSHGFMLEQLESAKIVMVFDPTVSDLDWLYPHCCKATLWIAVTSNSSTYANRPQLLERVDHVMTCQPEQYSNLAKDFFELITRPYVAGYSINEVSAIMSSARYSTFVSSPALTMTENLLVPVLRQCFDDFFHMKKLSVLFFLSFQSDFSTEDVEKIGRYFREKNISGTFNVGYRHAYAEEKMRFSCWFIDLDTASS